MGKPTPTIEPGAERKVAAVAAAATFIMMFYTSLFHGLPSVEKLVIIFVGTAVMGYLGLRLGRALASKPKKKKDPNVVEMSVEEFQAMRQAEQEAQGPPDDAEGSEALNEQSPLTDS